MLLTKHKEENFANIARGWALLADGGTLVCAGANDDGAASLERHVAKALGLAGTLVEIPLPRLLAHQGREGTARLLARPRRPATGERQLLAEHARHLQPGTASTTAPPCSRPHLPDDLAGHVADFGCGWGYLARETLARSPGIRHIDLIDAEHLALDAARANIKD